jgi:hypothetical protein
VQETAEEVDAFDRSRSVDFSGGGYWYIEADAAVRPSGVVVADVDLQDML